MRPPPEDPLDAALALVRSLADHEVSHALGGALALGLWAVPRATMDVDLNAFVDDDDLDNLFSALEQLGIPVDREGCRGQVVREGMFVVHWGRIRIDIFLPSIEYAWQAERTRRRVEIENQPVWVLSPEALAVFKLLFFRAKDLADLQRLLAVQGDKLDRSAIRESLVEMMGDGDERVVKWDQLVTEQMSEET